jgi:TonB family protein
MSAERGVTVASMALHRFILAAIAALLMADDLAACSAAMFDPNEMIENTPVYSANGRFCVIVRWYEGVADFKSERAGALLGLDGPEGEPFVPPPPTVKVAFYDVGAHRKLIAETAVERASLGNVMVADSGRTVVFVRGPGGACSRRSTADDAFLTIHTAEGVRIGTLKFGDIATPNDIERLWSDSVMWELRHETADREVVVLSFPTSPKKLELRVDIATALLLDPKREIFPAPHAYATAAAGPARSYGEPSTPDCAAAYGAAGLARVESRELVARAVRAPAPEFPPVELRARIRGTVVVDVIVSEEGNVICTRSTSSTFGFSEAAVAAARRWRFRPFRTGGDPSRVAGEILFHFEDVDEETWRELMQTSPH